MKSKQFKRSILAVSTVSILWFSACGAPEQDDDALYKKGNQGNGNSNGSSPSTTPPVTTTPTNGNPPSQPPVEGTPSPDCATVLVFDEEFGGTNTGISSAYIGKVPSRCLVPGATAVLNIKLAGAVKFRFGFSYKTCKTDTTQEYPIVCQVDPSQIMKSDGTVRVPLDVTLRPEDVSLADAVKMRFSMTGTPKQELAPGSPSLPPIQLP